LAGRDRLAFLDGGGEAGELRADAPDLGLDHGEHRRREFDSALGDQGLDQ